MIDYIHFNIYRNGFSSLVLVNENIMTNFKSVNFLPFNPFFEEFNGKVGSMISSGLIDHWYKNNLRLKRELQVEGEIGPEVLTMEHLEIGFIAFLIPLGLSFFVFICEIVAFHGRTLIHKIISR